MLRSFALAVALVAFASDASAQGEPAAAVQLFKDGRTLLQQGKYAEACEHFLRSDRLDPSVGARLSLGECNEGLGQSATAWGWYNAAASTAMQRRDPRAEIAKKRAAALEPKLAKITMRVTAGEPDLVVKRNGNRVDPAILETTVPIDAGPQTLDASAPGKKPWSTSFDIRDGESKEIRIPALEPDPSASTKPAGAKGDGASDGDSRRTLALGLEIGGGVALLSGLVIGGVAISKWSSVEDTCPDGRCRTDADRDRLTPDVSTARTLATVSTIVTGLGAVALIAGVVLHVTAPPRVAIVPLIDRQTAGIAGSFRF